MRVEHARRYLSAAWRAFWPIARQVLGWIFILLGLVGLVLPVLQGVLFLVIGVILIGRRNWLIRRARVMTKRALRRWADVRAPVLGPAGRMALRAQIESSRQSRRLHARYAAWARRRAARRAAPIAERAGD